jgi:DNA-binding transcriptional MerR regulator
LLINWAWACPNYIIIVQLERMSNGYRQFTDANVLWLTQIKVFIGSGISLKDIQKLTRLVLTGKQETLAQQRVIINQYLVPLIKSRSKRLPRLRLFKIFWLSTH